MAGPPVSWLTLKVIFLLWRQLASCSFLARKKEIKLWPPLLIWGHLENTIQLITFWRPYFPLPLHRRQGSSEGAGLVQKWVHEPKWPKTFTKQLRAVNFPCSTKEAVAAYARKNSRFTCSIFRIQNFGKETVSPKRPPTGKEKLRSTVKDTKEVTLVGTGGRWTPLVVWQQMPRRQSPDHTRDI